MNLPFEGVTVFEMGTSVAGPFAGKILAELGARAIKVENPDGGDPARKWYPVLPDGNSASFQSCNMDKLSLTVDMRDEGALARLRTLIAETADVVLQNLRPGAVERFGLDAETLRQDNPGLIYCNVGAFGAGGPLSHLPGYDPLMQAFSGITDLTGEADRPPSPGRRVADRSRHRDVVDHRHRQRFVSAIGDRRGRCRGYVPVRDQRRVDYLAGGRAGCFGKGAET